MKNTIFEILNQRRGNLGGSRNNDFIYNSKISDIPASKNSLSLSIRLGTRQKTSLKCSENAGIFIFISDITNTLISSVSWASPLKIVRSPKGVMVNNLYWLGINNAHTGSRNDLFLPLERSDGMNDRQLSYKNKIGLSASFWGLGVDRLVFSLASKISFPLTGLFKS